MNNSITKALLFVITLSTSIMSVQLIPFQERLICSICGDWNAGNDLIWKQRERERYSKAIDKSNYYLQKIYKELRIDPVSWRHICI